MEPTPQKTYIPAAGHDWFLPLYDPIVALLGGDAVRRALLDQAAIRAKHRILDIGCGTGTFVVLVKRLHPDVDVVGLDPDPKALVRGKRKAERAAVSIHFDQGFSEALPYGAASFDRVFSSLMFHHLSLETKERTLREVRRVLKPGSFLHIVDLAGPESQSHGFFGRLFHSRERLRDNFEGRILALMKQVGFTEPKEVGHRRTLLGPIAYYQASAPFSS
jgi:ubiquinone/menaquinone biosynthesis C-methylase UbiE